MTKAHSGRSKYDKSRRTAHQRPRPQKTDELHYGKLASVFIIFGLVSLLTAWYFNFNASKQSYTLDLSPTVKKETDKPVNQFGPIKVDEGGEVYDVSIKANLPVQSWSFVEGEVLNADEEYLFSFGKELWHETGRDSDGAWRENENDYSMKITFPYSGYYYLKFNVESNKRPDHVSVVVNRKNGSSLPHFWFGIVLILIGVVLNEIRNKTITLLLGDD